LSKIYNKPITSKILPNNYNQHKNKTYKWTP
jgi:hypothetical protein